MSDTSYFWTAQQKIPSILMSYVRTPQSTVQFMVICALIGRVLVIINEEMLVAIAFSTFMYLVYTYTGDAAASWWADQQKASTQLEVDLPVMSSMNQIKACAYESSASYLDRFQSPTHWWPIVKVWENISSTATHAMEFVQRNSIVGAPTERDYYLSRVSADKGNWSLLATSNEVPSMVVQNVEYANANTMMAVGVIKNPFQWSSVGYAATIPTNINYSCKVMK